MPDYSLGRAHGKIEIDYSDSGAVKAAKDLDSVEKSSTAADKSLTKTQRTLRDTEKELDSSGTAAQGYSARLRDVESASRDAETAERRHRDTLLDSRATLEDIKAAEDDAAEARKRHTRAVDAERAAHKALTDGMGGSRRALSALADIIPNLELNLNGLSKGSSTAASKTADLTGSLGGLTKVIAFLGPQGRAAAVGIEAITGSIGAGTDAISGFVSNIAGLELAVGKISGLALGGGSLLGLAGLGGAAGVQGIVNLAGAATQLSGSLGLLPAVISGVELSMGTLKVAFRGVDDALTDMMADDPKKFLEDIKNMGPVAGQAMLQVAQFRDQFKMAGATIQDSFFSQVAKDIAPLIQTLLPAVTAGMSKIATVLGGMADQFGRMLMQPQVVSAFESFVDNVAAGLQALAPAMAPLLQIFTQLTVTGSSFFQQIGGMVSQFLGPLADTVQRLAGSGQLAAWIQTGINAFSHLVNIVGNVGSAFVHIMEIADKFGGGGLLGWLDKLTDQFNKWTQSADGQKSLTDFFTVLRQATDAFLPMLGPLVQGLASIGGAFVQLGVATAPGWQTFFNTFATTMAQLAPQIVGIGPALNSFLTGMASAFAQLMATVGPKLPQIFQDLSNAFVALLPQIGPLVDLFLDLGARVGTQLPKLFDAITNAIVTLTPYFPILVDLFRNFVSALTWFIETGGSVINWFTNFSKAIGTFLLSVPQKLAEIGTTIADFFGDLPKKALEWGEGLIDGLIDGIKNKVGALGNTVRDVVEGIADWFQHSPAKRGPFSGDGYTMVRGQRMVTDMAAGMDSAQPAIAAAAAGTAATASSGLSSAGGGVAGGAPSPGGSDTSGNALLPDNIAGADVSPLTAYLRHQFSDTRGLKGLAKDFGDIMQVAQSGANLISQNVLQPLFQGLGMLPGSDAKTWRKMSPEALAAQQEKASAKEAAKGPDWADVFGEGAPGTANSKTPPPGSSVPLVQNPDGTWTSPNDAWAHLIARESSGVNQVQKITDVNSGGNEAEGLFQITPKTWQAHGGIDLAPNPLAATPQQQAAIAARILQANPTGSDWGAGLPGRESAAELLSGLTGPPAPGAKGPSWQEVTGAAAPAASRPTGEYGLPQGTDTGGYGTGSAKTFPAWVMALADRFGVAPSTYGGHQESDRNEAGYAPNPTHENRGIDWSGSVENMQKFADYLAQNAASMPGLEQIIWQNPNTGQKIGLGGAGNLDPGYYPQGTYDEHGNHVHTRQSAPLGLPGNPSVALGIGNQPGTGQLGWSSEDARQAAAAQPISGAIGVPLPSGKTADELLDATKQGATANDQLLQAYLQGNPALATQITAAQTAGAADSTVMDTLTGISSTITDLKTQDPVGNKNTIDALSSTQSKIAQQQGFESQPSALSQAQSIAGGISGAVSGVFQSIASGLDALAGTQDIADRLVYGIRNTEDISKIVDDVQKYIKYAADIISTAGSIVSTVGSFTGGADFGGTSAAGSALSLIASVLEGVNAAIDFGQQVYEITMGYVGQFMSVLTGLGGTDLMGNVGFLLNKNTGELISYSMDNPEQKNTSKVPSWMESWYDYNGKGNPNPQVQQQLNVFAGPGQSPGEMMNETMWMVNTGGTTGAMAPANF